MTETKTKGMVALIPTSADAERLAVEGGLPAVELHLTLLFLGDAAEWDDSARNDLIEAMRTLGGFGVVEGDAFALSMFNPASDEPCIVLGVGGQPVADFYNLVVEAAPDDNIPEQRAPWVAHTSLIYTGDLSQLAELVDRTGPITYDRLRIAFADTITDIPLTSEADTNIAPEAHVNPFLRNPAAYKRTGVRAEMPTVKPSGDGVVSLRLYDPIDDWGDQWGVSAKEFVTVLDALPDDTTEIRLLINSPGGNVWDGLAVLNALRAHPARFVAVVEGIAASAASFIAAGADELLMMPNARMMIHRAWGGCIGNSVDMIKMSTDLAGEDQNLADIYAGKAGGNVDEWLARMTDETFISAAEAVELGLADKVIEPTPAAKNAVADAKARFDLSVFQNKAKPTNFFADIDTTPTPVEAPVETPTEVPETAAVSPPELPAAEPEPITDPKEDLVSTDLSDTRSRLGLDDTADLAAINAAIDALKAQADTPTTPDPVITAEVEATTQENADLRKEIELVAAQMKAMSAELAATKAETAAKVKASFLDEAQKQGKFKPADRAQWDTDYDDAPAAVTRMLNRIEPGTAVPVTAAGEVGAPEPDGTDDEFDKIMARLDGPAARKVS